MSKFQSIVQGIDYVEAVRKKTLFVQTRKRHNGRVRGVIRDRNLELPYWVTMVEANVLVRGENKIKLRCLQYAKFSLLLGKINRSEKFIC